MTKIKIDIDQKRCKGCDLCLNLCPKQVFQETSELGDKGFKIRKPIATDKCTECGLCKYFCPEGAISINDKPLIDLAWQKSAEMKKNATQQNKERGGWRTIKTINPGRHFISGNTALARAISDIGADYIHYPITPISEVAYGVSEISEKIPERICFQAESEDNALMMICGACAAGRKVITGTSDPGAERMMENLAYALTNELPIVIAVAQRTCPSTGRATGTGAWLVRAMRWGPHGGTEHIVIYPSNIQEIYDYAIKAFNLAEIFRVPVILLFEASTAHLEENIEIPEKIKVFDRIYKPGEPLFGPVLNGSVPSMPKYGDGELLKLTGLTHNQWGVSCSDDPEIHEQMVNWQRKKIISKIDELIGVEEYLLDDAEIMIVAYGHTARSARWAINKAREKGIKVGLLKLNILYPFPEKKIEKWSVKVRCVLVPEMNQGQIFYVVRESSVAPVISLPQPDGESIKPARILEFLEKDLTKYFSRNCLTSVSTFYNPFEWQKQNVKIPERIFDPETIFCSGCGLGVLRNCLLSAIKEMDLDTKKILVVSGIGCTARMSNHLPYNSANTTHGYPIAFASGVKLANKDLTAFVVSGDGDLFNIGLTQTLYGAKRNIPMVVICFNNSNFGMTGGQFACTTPLGAKTSTTPLGNKEKPFDLIKLILSSGAEFAVRCPISKSVLLKNYIKKAIKSNKFAFIEVDCPCLTHYVKRNIKVSPYGIQKLLNEFYISKQKARNFSFEEFQEKFELGFPFRKNTEILLEEVLQIIYGRFSNIAEYLSFIPKEKKQ
jgi:2-oxoglutarate ferredoxin oxidoreductase subunit alpha